MKRKTYEALNYIPIVGRIIIDLCTLKTRLHFCGAASFDEQGIKDFQKIRKYLAEHPDEILADDNLEKAISGDLEGR